MYDYSIELTETFLTDNCDRHIGKNTTTLKTYNEVNKT